MAVPCTYKILSFASLIFMVFNGLMLSYYYDQRVDVNNFEMNELVFPLPNRYNETTTITKFGSIMGEFIDYENSTARGIKYGEAKICIISIFINYAESVKHRRTLNHKQYAQLWGYSYFYIDNISHVAAIDKSEHFKNGKIHTPKWYKTWVILEVLKWNKFDYILWMDSDAVFMNCHIPLTYTIKNVVNLLHENKNDKLEDYSMLISPDINHMNSGVIVFKNDEWSRKLIKLWIEMYYKLEEISFPKYYPWGGDNCALVMLLNGYDPKTMDLSEKEVNQYLPHIYAEHIDVVRELQFNQFVLQKSYQHRVGLIPQSFFNSFERYSNTHLILHCAGSRKCKNILPLVLPTSTCSKSNILYLNEKYDIQPTNFDDAYLKSYCIFQSYDITKCIDRILNIFKNMRIKTNYNHSSINYHIYYERESIHDDFLLFILSFLATQRNINTKLIIWKPLRSNNDDNDIITLNNIKNVFLKDLQLNIDGDCINRIQVKMFNISLWDEIARNYKLVDNKIDLHIGEKSISHLVRFVILYHFGGIWFEVDTVLLKDFHILYNQEWMYPYSWKAHVNTAIMSLNKYTPNGTIDVLFRKLFKFTIKKEKKNITYNTFNKLNILDHIHEDDQPQLKILPIYLFDPTWYQRDIRKNSQIIDQNHLQYPYWLPPQKNNNESYFMFLNEFVDEYSWNKINKNINNFLSYSMANHYHDEVLRVNNILNGSWLDLYRKEYQYRIQNQSIC